MMGQDTCNLPAPYGIQRPSRTDLGSIFDDLFGGALGDKKQNSPEDIASELRTFGGRLEDLNFLTSSVSGEAALPLS